MQMQALKAHRYTLQRQPGDRYDAKDGDVRLIVALGWAAPAAPIAAEVARPPVRPARALRAARMIAAEPAPAAVDEAPAAVDPPSDAAESVVVAERARRTYTRRDLKAESSE